MATKQKKASRMMMRNRLGKRRNRQIAAYEKRIVAGETKSVPINRAAKRSEHSWVSHRVGRSVAQAAREKRKAEAKRVRARARKQQAASRQIGRSL